MRKPHYTKQSGSGIELRGPQRWRVKANWKIGAENFAGDMYHTPQTHTSVVEIGLFREPKAEKRKDGATYWAGAGGGTTYKLPEGDLDERLRYVGYPQEMVDRMKQHLSSDQLKVIGDDGFMISAASIYPNLSLVHNWPRVADSEDVLPFISIRQWQPISEDETEVLSWFAVDAEAPEEFKALSYKAYLMCFGSTGMFEQDDVENWVSLTNTAAGSMARRLRLNSRMGILEDDTEVIPQLTPEQFHGPGSAHTGYSEYNQRALLNRWADDLEKPMSIAATVEVGGPGEGARDASAKIPAPAGEVTAASYGTAAQA
ncbi:RHO alpha subunit C-terminal catalytic domain-containing protein [Modestobacter lapidis]